MASWQNGRCLASMGNLLTQGKFMETYICKQQVLQGAAFVEPLIQRTSQDIYSTEMYFAYLRLPRQPQENAVAEWCVIGLPSLASMRFLRPFQPMVQLLLLQQLTTELAANVPPWDPRRFLEILFHADFLSFPHIARCPVCEPSLPDRVWNSEGFRGMVSGYQWLKENHPVRTGKWNITACNSCFAPKMRLSSQALVPGTPVGSFRNGGSPRFGSADLPWTLDTSWVLMCH